MGSSCKKGNVTIQPDLMKQQSLIKYQEHLNIVPINSKQLLKQFTYKLADNLDDFQEEFYQKTFKLCDTSDFEKEDPVQTMLEELVQENQKLNKSFIQKKYFPRQIPKSPRENQQQYRVMLKKQIKNQRKPTTPMVVRCIKQAPIQGILKSQSEEKLNSLTDFTLNRLSQIDLKFKKVSFSLVKPQTTNKPKKYQQDHNKHQ